MTAGTRPPLGPASFQEPMTPICARVGVQGARPGRVMTATIPMQIARA